MNLRPLLLGTLLFLGSYCWPQATAPAPPATQKPAVPIDREAFTITRWDLNVALDTGQGTLGSRGKIQLRNDSDAPLDVISLQISSSLRWSAVHLSEKPIDFTSTRIVSDIDHTGAVNEAVVRLPKSLAPGATIELEIGYSGVVRQDATRLERVGTPGELARRSDWDRIGEDFTGVRGAGNVAWYPVSMTPERLGNGNLLFESLGRWKARHADSSFHAFYTVEREMTLVSNRSHVVLTGDSGGKPVALIESNLLRLGTETPFFVAGKYKSFDTPKAKVFYFPSSEVAARRYAGVMEELEPPFANAKSAKGGEGVRKIASPLIREAGKIESMMGAGKESPVALIELPGDLANFESGPILLLPLRDLAEKQLQQLLIHTITHGAFYSKRSWLYEGVAHYAQVRLIEEQDGRRAALDFLEQRRNALAVADSDERAGSNSRQSLVVTSDEVFYRSKAMFVWWMLHDMIGDAAVTKAMVEYRADQDKEPAYIERLLEAASGRNLDWFFNDWVYRDRGLPDFQITSVYPRQNLNGGYMVTVSVENLGSAAAEVPVRLRTREGEVTTRLEVMGKEKASARIEVRDRPLEATVNDGSVPESDLNNNSFSVPSPP